MFNQRTCYFHSLERINEEIRHTIYSLIDTILTKGPKGRSLDGAIWTGAIMHARNHKSSQAPMTKRLLGKGNGIYRNALHRRTERKKDAKKAHVKTSCAFASF